MTPGTPITVTELVSLVTSFITLMGGATIFAAAATIIVAIMALSAIANKMFK